MWGELCLLLVHLVVVLLFLLLLSLPLLSAALTLSLARVMPNCGVLRRLFRSRFIRNRLILRFLHGLLRQAILFG